MEDDAKNEPVEEEQFNFHNLIDEEGEDNNLEEEPKVENDDKNPKIK
jgi:hypothetical protein